MKRNNNKSDHTFLFWLIVPCLIAWLAFNYVRTLLFITNNPQIASADNSVINAAPVGDIDYPPLPPSDSGYITFWFDDAWISQYLKGAQILNEYGYVGTLAVPTQAVGKPNYMNWAQVKILQELGWEITNHSRFHDCTMQDWSRTKIRNELRYATMEMWNQDLASDVFVSPCGVNSTDLEEEATRQFSAYRTVEPGFNDLNNLDSYHLKVKNIQINTTFDEIKSWIDESKQNRYWLIIVFHQIGAEINNDKDEQYGIEESTFRQLIEEINNSGLAVVTPSQIFEDIIWQENP